MYYELYIDVYFLVNFLMDTLLLFLVNSFLRCSATHRRIFLGGALASVLTCVVFVLPIRWKIIKMLLFHILVNYFMIYFTFRMKEWRMFVKAVVLLYVSGFLLGGIFTALRGYLKAGSLFFFLAVVSYYGAKGVGTFLMRIQRQSGYACTVTLYDKEGSFSVKALIDTGNLLRDGVSQEPVSVIGQEIKEERGWNLAEYSMRYIPVHTVGANMSMLPMIRLPKMEIGGKRVAVIEHPLLAISETCISSDGEYEMILNPELYEEGKI